MMRRRRSHTVVDVWQRQLGVLSTGKFNHRRRASEDLVVQLALLRKLKKRGGFVNSINFNADGSILVSGCDDGKVVLWDWKTGKTKLSFHSGHQSDVLQANFMPHSDDRNIVNCGTDGQVRHAQILEGGEVETILLGRHLRAARKLAVEPGNPYVFYTSGEDGVVQRFDLRTKNAVKLFTCEQMDGSGSMQLVGLYALSFDPNNPNVFAVAGSDEYARLYDIRKCRCNGSTNFGQPTNHFCPPHLLGHLASITGLAFSDQSELLVSYKKGFIYLFTQDMGLGPNCRPAPAPAPTSISNSEEVASQVVYKGHVNSNTMMDVSFFGPKCKYLVSGSDCGKIFIWKKDDGKLIHKIAADRYIVNCVKSHPHITALASSGLEFNIKIWTPDSSEKASQPPNIIWVPHEHLEDDEPTNLLHVGWMEDDSIDDLEDDDSIDLHQVGELVDDSTDDEDDDGSSEDEEYYDDDGNTYYDSEDDGDDDDPDNADDSYDDSDLDDSADHACEPLYYFDEADNDGSFGSGDVGTSSDVDNNGEE